MTSITFYGGAGSVTGSNFLLEAAEKKILVDCGLSQGSPEAERRNTEAFGYEPSSIDLLFVTHSHIDHVGLIPKLAKEGFSGEIFSTPETKELATLMLLDAAKVGRQNESALYTSADVEKALGLWKTLGYHEPTNFGDLSLELFDAGHILGSAMLEFGLSEGKLMFTGDLGNSPSPLLMDTERVQGLDYLVMESVYGDRNHEGRQEREEKFREAILEAHRKGGTLLIPAFSLERTQIILYELDNLFESGQVPSMPVFLDSPLAIRVTEIYDRVSKHYNAAVQKEIREGDRIFDFKKLTSTAQIRDSREIALVPGPKIIIAGSGMSNGGRIVGHEALYLPDPKTTILFMGYQAPGTLGRKIEEGAKVVEIDGVRVPVRAEMRSISGFSAHADSDALVNFVGNTKDTLKRAFVAMGEPRSSIFLAQRLRDELGVEALVPERGKTYSLLNGV